MCMADSKESLELETLELIDKINDVSGAELDKLVDTLLPKIKSGILCLKDTNSELNLTADVLHDQNIKYAKHYSPKRDFNILIKSMKSLGN